VSSVAVPSPLLPVRVALGTCSCYVVDLTSKPLHHAPQRLLERPKALMSCEKKLINEVSHSECGVNQIICSLQQGADGIS
jgi:hypothetical protein